MSIGQFIILVFLRGIVCYIIGCAIDEKRVGNNEIRNKTKNVKRTSRKKGTKK